MSESTEPAYFKYVQFILIQIALFTVIAVISLSSNISFEGLLIIFGIVILVLPYIGSYSRPSAHSMYSDTFAQSEMRHNLETTNKRGKAPLLNPIQLYALPLLVVGTILTMIP